MSATAVSPLERLDAYISHHGRPLDVARFRHAVGDADVDAVVGELARFQNDDGGFGHGLESDLRLPSSSPICTWVGLGQLVDLGVDADAPIVQRALAYLRGTYDEDEGRWPPVGPEVNDHPHAGWFHFDPGKGGTAIHQTPWNPTAALTGFLWHFGFEPPPALAPLTERAVAYLRAHAGEDLEMHELHVLVQLARHAPEPHAAPLRELTTAAVLRIVERTRDEWGGYGAQPLHFVDGPRDFLYTDVAELRACVDDNLDWCLERLGDDGAWPLPYQWYRDEDEFERLKPELTASFAVHRVSQLRAFGRL